MNIRTFVAFLSQNLQYNFPKTRGGVKGHLELFRKNIRFGVFSRPLGCDFTISFTSNFLLATTLLSCCLPPNTSASSSILATQSALNESHWVALAANTFWYIPRNSCSRRATCVTIFGEEKLGAGEPAARVGTTAPGSCRPPPWHNLPTGGFSCAAKTAFKSV